MSVTAGGPEFIGSWKAQYSFKMTQNSMRCGPFVFPIVGAMMIAAGTANIHYLVDVNDDGHWASLVFIELELLGGLWLTSGLYPKCMMIICVVSFMILLVYDLILLFSGWPPRHGFGQMQTGPWMNLGLDLASGLALLCYLPARGRPALLDSHPRRVLLLTVLSIMVGVAIDREHFCKYPAIGVSASSDPADPIGLRYLLYLPGAYHYSWGNWPLILYLHGSGSVGDDLQKVRLEGLARRAEGNRGLPFVVVAPQCPSGGWNIFAVDALLDQVLTRYRIDPDRVYLTGSSMGGYATWSLAIARPGRFAAIAPICGGGDPTKVEVLRTLPTWAFHGARDDVVPLPESRRMVDALKAIGGEVNLTIYPETGHDAWTATYDNPELYSWLNAQRRRAASPKIW